MQCPFVPIKWEHTTCFTAMLPPPPPNHTHYHCVAGVLNLKVVFEKTEDFYSAILKEQVAECLRQIVWNTQCFLLKMSCWDEYKTSPPQPPWKSIPCLPTWHQWRIFQLSNIVHHPYQSVQCVCVCMRACVCVWVRVHVLHVCASFA